MGRLTPPRGTPEHISYTYWLHYAEGSAMPPLLLKLVFQRVEKSPAPFFARPIIRQLTKRVQQGLHRSSACVAYWLLGKELEAHTWFAGEEFTAADVQMSYPVEAAASRGGMGKTYPKLQAFSARIQARPAYQRALERGGPYLAA